MNDVDFIGASVNAKSCGQRYAAAARDDERGDVAGNSDSLCILVYLVIYDSG